MNKQIIIIGAGPSGVAAATRLVANGFRNVHILEGSNRIGGRVNTVPFGANVVDMGAQWCHGEKGNVVYEMAKDKNVLAYNTLKSVGGEFIRSNGEVIPTELSKKLYELAFAIYEGDEYEEEKYTYNGSFGNFYATKFKEALKSDEFKDMTPELAHECFDLFHKIINSIDGCDSWYELSCDSHEYETNQGDLMMNWKDKGYITVFDLLQNKIPGGEDLQPVIDVMPLIKFNKEVIKITYNQPDGLIKLECKDGSSYSADHVICTVSLGVLKERHLRMFKPMLPLYKHKAIDGMKIGTVGKIFLEFEQPFWEEGWTGISLLWKLEQIKEVSEDPINGDWLDGICEMYPFNPLQPNVIIAWITGEKAHRMEEKSDADVKAGAEKVLRMFLKNQDIPDAKAMIRSKWHSNPLFRGSYTCYSIKAEALGANVQQLAEPVTGAGGRPVIQFAGEATSAKYFSNVHGAVESGWREADRLIQLYKHE